MITQKMEYSSFDGTKKSIHFYFPDDWKKDDRRGAAVLFHGGGWIRGTADQFVPHASELTRLGMVVALPSYRLLESDHATVDIAVRDAMAALQFVFDNSSEMGIDPQKVVAGGGSAGGHLAMSAVLLDEFMPQGYTCKHAIQALLLFNPVIDAVDIKERNESLKLCSYDAKQLSPYHHLRPNMPETLIFQGTADTVVPLSHLQEFEKKMEELGNACHVFLYEGRQHSFFNLTSTNVIQDYYDILGHVVDFLFRRNILEIKIKKVDD